MLAILVIVATIALVLGAGIWLNSKHEPGHGQRFG
jgi:hypothetical protein